MFVHKLSITVCTGFVPFPVHGKCRMLGQEGLWCEMLGRGHEKGKSKAGTIPSFLPSICTAKCLTQQTEASPRCHLCISGHNTQCNAGAGHGASMSPRAMRTLFPPDGWKVQVNVTAPRMLPCTLSSALTPLRHTTRKFPAFDFTSVPSPHHFVSQTSSL